MSDCIMKTLNPHDIARHFAEDVENYVKITGSLDDLSATNVYDSLRGYEKTDSFKESVKAIEKVNTFRTEFARDRYLIKTIMIHETLLELDEDTIKAMRKDVCDRDDIEEWEVEELTRYAFLVMNLSMMKNRGYLQSLEGKTARERYVHLIFDRYLEVIGNEKK